MTRSPRMHRNLRIRRGSPGFTLMGLTVVFVLIGLLVVGILVGQSLIHAFKLRSVIVEVRDFQTVINTFQLKYKELPGDFQKATEYWPAGGIFDGNGNGEIERLQKEDYKAWQHLALASLIPGTYTGTDDDGKSIIGLNVPPSRIDRGGYMIRHQFPTLVYGTKGHVLELAGELTTYLWAPVVSAQDAYSIDVKIDDGLADTGEVYTLKGLAVGNSELPGCVTNGYSASSSEYILTDTRINCRMFFWLD